MKSQPDGIASECHTTLIKELLDLIGKGGLWFSLPHGIMVPGYENDLDMVRQPIELLGDGFVLIVDIRDLQILIMPGIHSDPIHDVTGKHQILDPG